MRDYRDPRGGHAGGTAALAKADTSTHAITHGLGIARGLMPCTKCVLKGECEAFVEAGRCALEAEYVETRRGQLTQALEGDGYEAALYESLTQSAILAEVRLFRLVRYLGVTGEMLPGGEAGFAELQPAAKEIPVLQTRVEKSLAALNLTPATRARLEVSKSPEVHPMIAAVLLAEAAKGEPEGDDDTDES